MIFCQGFNTIKHSLLAGKFFGLVVHQMEVVDTQFFFVTSIFRMITFMLNFFFLQFSSLQNNRIILPVTAERGDIQPLKIDASVVQMEEVGESPKILSEYLAVLGQLDHEFPILLWYLGNSNPKFFNLDFFIEEEAHILQNMVANSLGVSIFFDLLGDIDVEVVQEFDCEESPLNLTTLLSGIGCLMEYFGGDVFISGLEGES